MFDSDLEQSSSRIKRATIEFEAANVVGEQRTKAKFKMKILIIKRPGRQEHFLAKSFYHSPELENEDLNGR